MKFLALDSGSRKWGYAVFDGNKVMDKGIIKAEELEKAILSLKLLVKPDFIVIGSRKGALKSLSFLKDIDILTVSESETTLKAKELYFSEFPPRGLMRFLPKGLRVPERPIDDFAAVIIGRRFLNSMEGVYRILKDEMRRKIKELGLSEKEISIEARILSSKEAIGSPERKDFPLVRGKEHLIEANFMGAKGQAFTDEPSNFRGKIEDIINLRLGSNRERALFIASINAFYRHIGEVKNTIHCKNEEPEKCAEKLVSFIGERWGNPKVGLVGYQPAFLEACARNFRVRVLDLNPELIGRERYGVKVESGDALCEEIMEWADVLLVTGSTIVNGTISKFLDFSKPVLFYGVTIAAPALTLGLERFCPLSH